MSIIQDKLGNEFLRSNGSMDSSFGPGMIMFSHLPPVTSFTRLAAHSVVQDLPPADVILKKERDSPDCSMDAQGGRVGCASMGDYVHAMGIKQENLSEQDSCLLVYPGATGKSAGLLGLPASNNQNLLMHDLSVGQVSITGFSPHINNIQPMLRRTPLNSFGTSFYKEKSRFAGDCSCVTPAEA